MIFNSVFAKNLAIPPDPLYKEEIARKDVYKALKAVSTYYLGKSNFIAGDKPTIADLSAYYEIQFLLLTGENFEKWPVIKGWLDRMGQIKEVKQANQVFIKVIGKFNPNAKL